MEILLDRNLEIVYFERIVSDYNYFETHVLKKLKLHLDQDTWKSMVSIKENRTRTNVIRFIYAKLKGNQYVADRLPSYAFWPDEYKIIFNEICGRTMSKLGYE